MPPTPAGLPPLALSLLLLCGCGRGCERVEDSAEEPLRWEPADTVVLITIDSLSPRILMGESWDWEVAPTLHTLFDESVLLPRVLTPMGITRPALASLITALYPAQHGIRSNSTELRSGTSVLRMFREAGYRSYGFSANQCPLIQDGDVDEYFCTWNDELSGSYGLRERDRLLVEELNRRLLEQPADEPLFLWLHLNNVHHPFIADRDQAEAFFGAPYQGELNPGDDEMLAEITLGERSLDEDEQRYLEATYAAQLTETDALIGSVLDSLVALGRYDEAVVMVGADHGEELADHLDHRYFWHGCSPYNSVLQVVYAVRAPGRVEGGGSLDAWVSSTDLAPTLVDLASAFHWRGPRSGASLVDAMLGGPAPDAAIFASRGSGTALVVQDERKYQMADTELYQACSPYSGTELGYPGAREELYDLLADPREEDNLVEPERERADQLRTLLCTWMAGVGWVPPAEQDGNELWAECEDWLCEQGSELCPE
jgi:arylsulfatase A-like enzyme